MDPSSDSFHCRYLYLVVCRGNTYLDTCYLLLDGSYWMGIQMFYSGSSEGKQESVFCKKQQFLNLLNFQNRKHIICTIRKG